VRRGAFREDLFFRLDVIRIHLPPLRERPEDVTLLAERFQSELAGGPGRSARLRRGCHGALARASLARQRAGAPQCDRRAQLLAPGLGSAPAT